MKKLLTILAVPVLGLTLAAAQDQPATKTDATNPAATEVAQPNRNVPQRSENNNFGWIGLLGLLGLAGLKRRNQVEQVHSVDRTRDYTTPENIRRAG